jgi:hypothetical protein
VPPGRALNNFSSFLMDEDPRAALEASREGIALNLRLGARSFQTMDNAVTAAGYRHVLGVWRDLGLVWDEALCAIDMARVLDPTDPEVRAAADAAREILVRLEAARFIDRLDAALAPVAAPIARSAALMDGVRDAQVKSV